MIAVFSSDQYFERIYNSLNKSDIGVSFLVTECEKPSGRGQIMTKNPAHEFAQKIGLKTQTFKTLGDEAYETLKCLVDINNAKLGFVFSYGKIIPERFIKLFELGIINVHFSLLPVYRGAAPLQGALLNNDKKTGLTYFLIDKGLDTGKILKQIEFEINDDDDFESLKDRALKITADFLPDLLNNYCDGKIKPIAQKTSGKSYSPEINKADGLIDKNDSAQSALGKIRAYSVWPKAYMVLDGKRVIILKARLNSGKLEIDTIQVEGKNPITFSQFKTGYNRLLTVLPDFVNIN